jgi:ATP-dependent exoDNAse (exonuclease V) beta subunit
MNRPPSLTHEAILASAGSGKTYALVTRYLQLLACGQAPERIIALTFTRKAAGEFFDKILQRLAEAAADERARAALADALGRPGLERDEVVAWLRRIVDSLPQLSLGTLDSFFIRIVSAFALEFGLGGPFRLLEGADIAREREELCRAVFQALPPDRQHEQDDFIEAFNLATFGTEEKSLHRAFDAFIEEHHQAWLLDPVADKWGRPAAVWPALPWYLQSPATESDALLGAFTDALDTLALTAQQRNRLLEIGEQLAAHQPGTAASGTFDYLQKNILPSLRDLRRGQATFKVYRTLTLEGPACQALTALIGRVLAGEAAAMLQRTQGLAALLSDYERHHESEVRLQGRLTFDDVKFLLARGGPGGDGLARLAVDARLDARFDHWLIDEFQDTSLLQWEVLRPLVEEALEDPEGARTYFQVGDEKQSIYRWRGGEPELGRHVIERYQLATRPLNDSWRSAPPVIAAVNAVFGNDEALSSVLPPAAAERWRAGWVPHTTRHAGRPGCAALVRPERGEPTGDGGSALECELEVVAAMLREMRPLQRRLSVAILLRGNDDVAAAVDFLRRQDGLPPVVSETDASVAVDNPLTLALLSLLRVAAHPGDTMAWEHVKMTPLAALWAKEESGRGQVVRQTLQEVWADGLEAWVRRWTAQLDPMLEPEDAFSRLRAAQLAGLARDFDARGSRDLDAFLRAAELATARESAWSDAVQVMTIHKSKGLDFDIVFLPRLAGKAFHDDSRQLLLRARGEDFETRWLVRRPPAVLVASDEVLRDAREANQAAQAYEGLCVFYVAMTRARHAVYLVGGEGAGDGVARNGAALVERALAGGGGEESIMADGRAWACGWCAGDPRWFETVPLGGGAEAAAKIAAEPPPFVPTVPGARRRPRLTPSGRESHVLTADQVFSLEASPARELGTLVHALFERVDDPGDRAAVEAWWKAGHPAPAGWERDAWSQVRACLDEEGVRAVLQTPADSALWREKRFEVILDGEWVTGTFDRVVVGVDRALIVDFKTDAVRDEAAARERAEGYRPQLDLYRRVLARLTGLDPSVISTVLVFTRLRLVVATADGGMA